MVRWRGLGREAGGEDIALQVSWAASEAGSRGVPRADDALERALWLLCREQRVEGRGGSPVRRHGSHPGEGVLAGRMAAEEGVEVVRMEVAVVEPAALDKSDVVGEGKEGSVGARGFCPEQPERWGLHREEGAHLMPKRFWFWSLTCCG